MELDYIFFLRATRKFYEVELIDFNIGDGLIGFDLVGDDGNIFHSNSGEGDICKFIGIKDINGDKIYTDSSIVESCNGIVGFITYHDSSFSYVFKSINSEINYTLNKETIKSMKIIDTIQENKLGLV